MIVFFSAFSHRKNLTPICNYILFHLFCLSGSVNHKLHCKYKENDNTKCGLEFMLKYRVAVQMSFWWLWRTEVCSITADKWSWGAYNPGFHVKTLLPVVSCYYCYSSSRCFQMFRLLGWHVKRETISWIVFSFLCQVSSVPVVFTAADYMET